jgi:hypothetical protein
MKIGFFEESPDNRSMSRLLSFIFGVYAVVSSGFVLFKNPIDYAGCIAVFSAIAGISLGIKLIQKPMENKEIKDNTIVPIN